jgi:asparagine synthase (glutamine-hydrolysing)
MCGIIGVCQLTQQQPENADTLCQMLGMIRHRGPDGNGIYLSDRVALGSSRLSIIDLSSGDQPISNEDQSLWIVFNGEIFNYLELRPELEKHGHIFRTHSDTEVIIHLYEMYGSSCLQYLNGQFAIALWNETDQSLFLGRDRLGVRPLYYTVQKGKLIFGSEIKAILAYPDVIAELSPETLRQIFTFWGPLSPYSAFKDIYELPPGHFLVAKDGQLHIEQYWGLDFSWDSPVRPDDQYQQEFESLLADAVHIRLRADVPVGAYLSGGLDSSVLAALIRQDAQSHLDTFSITFSDPNFDESTYQREMVQALKTDHHSVHCTYEEIGRIFPQVVWNAEVPLLRTSPAPMLLLSQLVRQHGYKVVLTGEGADEFLGGYDLFKEMKIRRFWAKNPESQIRPRLLGRLYPEINGLSSGVYLKAFFSKDLTHTDSPFYSHLIRWKNTARTWRFFQEKVDPQEPLSQGVFNEISLPKGYSAWSSLGQAQFLEVVTFLSTYLLSAQGDRMSMANSVEGRYPFLDHRLVEFCNRLPDNLKLPGLTEKWILRQLGRKMIPPNIWQRRKRPYRAPVHPSFFASPIPDYVESLLSKDCVRQAGYFDPEAVELLVNKTSSGSHLSEVEDMALVGILSTQLLHYQYICTFSSHIEGGRNSLLKLVDQRETKELSSVSKKSSWAPAGDG